MKLNGWRCDSYLLSKDLAKGYGFASNQIKIVLGSPVWTAVGVVSASEFLFRLVIAVRYNGAVSTLI
ncbi:MAG: hypothetical protein NTZ09_07555 [Candidatus Hydrogenedentes bacterium]|nr:hypothetical protein [Candidatus Hydrogenedentota bacterium]